MNRGSVSYKVSGLYTSLFLKYRMITKNGFAGLKVSGAFDNWRLGISSANENSLDALLLKFLYLCGDVTI